LAAAPAAACFFAAFSAFLASFLSSFLEGSSAMMLLFVLAKMILILISF
jgi:hypothetical protein